MDFLSAYLANFICVATSLRSRHNCEIALLRNETSGSQRVNERPIDNESTFRAIASLVLCYLVISIEERLSENSARFTSSRKIPAFTSSSEERGFSDDTQRIGRKE